MTKKTLFFENGILLTAVAIVARTVGIFFNAFVTKTVGAAGMGLFTLIMTVYGFAVTFATAGIGLAVTRLVAKAIGEKREREVPAVVKTCLFYALLFSLSAAAILFSLSSVIAKGALSDERAALPLRLLSLSLPFTALIVVIGGYFTAIRKVKRNAAVQVVTGGLKILITLFKIGKAAEGGTVAAVRFLCGLSTLFEAISAFVLVCLFLLDAPIRHRERDVARYPKRKVFALAFPLALSAYIRSALVTVEHILIPKCLEKFGQSTESALASYGVLHGMVVPLILYPMAALSSFAGLLIPEFAEAHAEKNNERMTKITERALGATIVFAVGVSVCLCYFSEELGYCVYHSYEAGYYTAVLCCVIPIMYLDHVTDAILKGIGEQVYSMWVNITDAALSVLLVLILLPKLGILGYAVVIAAMEGYNFLLSFLRLKKRIAFRLSLPSTVLPPLLAGACGTLLCRAVFKINGRATDGSLLLLKMIFTAAMFFLFLWIFSLFSSRKFRKNGKKQLLF